MFEKRVTLSELDNESKEYKPLGMGILRILYDDTIYGARIQMYDDVQDLKCDHAIAVQTCLRHEKTRAFWAAIDISVEPPCKRHFCALFSSINALKEFIKIFEEGKQMAIESEIVEEEDEESMFRHLIQMQHGKELP
ncbi:uncharacterized protein LOC111629977 [Centruroides sculpturatus]|uniref:uncharacterized protein LOC111629977 n=1 Tax=Centruroides sculpturatus TaxID=218467 RepID=UPI000C6E4101|nr:uncharacterized protein LOC111629977 [Centruroides sculpturatus]